MPAIKQKLSANQIIQKANQALWSSSNWSGWNSCLKSVNGDEFRVEIRLNRYSFFTPPVKLNVSYTYPDMQLVYVGCAQEWFCFTDTACLKDICTLVSLHGTVIVTAQCTCRSVRSYLHCRCCWLLFIFTLSLPGWELEMGIEEYWGRGWRVNTAGCLCMRVCIFLPEALHVIVN